MRLALAQVCAGPDRDANLEKALGAMDRASGEGADAIVFPELAVDRFFPRTPGTRRRGSSPSRCPER